MLSPNSKKKVHIDTTRNTYSSSFNEKLSSLKSQKEHQQNLRNFISHNRNQKKKGTHVNQSNTLGEDNNQKQIQIIKYIGDDCEILIDKNSDNKLQERNLNEIKQSLDEKLAQNVHDVNNMSNSNSQQYSQQYSQQEGCNDHLVQKEVM